MTTAKNDHPEDFIRKPVLQLASGDQVLGVGIVRRVVDARSFVIVDYEGGESNSYDPTDVIAVVPPLDVVWLQAHRVKRGDHVMLDDTAEVPRLVTRVLRWAALLGGARATHVSIQFDGDGIDVWHDRERADAVRVVDMPADDERRTHALAFGALAHQARMNRIEPATDAEFEGL